MSSASLRPLLEQVWGSPTFGAEAFAMDEAEREAAVGVMARALVGFTTDMRDYLAVGLPELDEQMREGLLQGKLAITMAFSPGLSAGDIHDPQLLSDMGVMTAITGVGNTLCDHGDPAMPPAILRLCRQEAAMPAGVDPSLVDSRLAMLRGIEHKARSIAAEGDEPRILEVVRDGLMPSEVKAHELSLAYLAADNKSDFWHTHANEAAATLLTTAALPTATTPLYSIYTREFKDLPSLAEVYAEPAIGELLVRANAIIRVQDDGGDRIRDARPSSFSLNLFNQPAMVEAFCRQAGMADEVILSKMTHAFAEAMSPEQIKAVTQVFITYFWQQYEKVPQRFEKYRQLVLRALAAGEANELGDDTLAGTAA